MKSAALALVGTDVSIGVHSIYILSLGSYALSMRALVFWIAMTFYAAAITTCIAAAVWAWGKATPSKGRGSIVYLSPFTNVFLGLAFIVSGASDVPRRWLRVTYILVGLFQFWPAWSIWNRRRQLREIRSPQ